MRTALAVLAAVAFMFTACNKVENNEIDQILAGKGKKGTTAPTPATDTKPATSGAVSDVKGLGWEDAKVKEIQRLVAWGLYDQAVDKAGASTDPYVRYFLGIAYYGKMLETGKFSTPQRNEFNSKAISILKELGNASRDELLAARSLLWAGMAVHLWHEDLPGNEEALSVFATVMDKYKDTEVANDAILYAAKVNQKIGRYPKAKELYNRLGAESFRDNMVYDPHLGRWFTPKDACALGLERVRQLTTPGWRPPQPQASSSAPAQNQTQAASTAPAESSTSSSQPASSTSTSTSSSSSTTSSSSSTAPASSSSTTPAATSTGTESNTSSTTTTTSSSSTSSNSTSSTAPAASSGSTAAPADSNAQPASTSSTSTTTAPASNTTPASTN